MSEPAGRDRYHFELPPDRIAQHPSPSRRASRLLTWRADGTLEHRTMAQLPGLIGAGDVVVINDTRVIPARLLGTKVQGSARVEVLLVSATSASSWLALVRPGRRLPAGTTVRLDGDLEVQIGAPGPDGTREVHFPAGTEVEAFAWEHGHVPLPPYIDRADDDEDRRRYQTVYARVLGSVAAPTAGLHFDRELLSEVEATGASIAPVTLHVGPGTFRPVTADHLERGRLHAEWAHVPAETMTAVRGAGRVIAVGTTSCRALESVPEDAASFEGATDLFIRPGFAFRAVDVLITNFHLPGSSLLMLVAAFAGERWRDAYDLAIAQGYRFYSYGDANWIERA